ncbi:large proline-rich protein bag6-B [Nylanderia fulva]|uniref:large proline-rich protein bag6-B n=1 Tax=Nylanderia fulva TaxID=613905 RepID=UPI0010FB49D6|nr:large proline-rich protein bag6-B [Nylanderia fulva]
MIDLTVKTLDSQNHVFSLEDDQITVRGFKEHIAESVAVPADSQRLIYCGRVLQDDKKLNDYDVNGKVIHLVQRAPPQPGQHGNDGGQSQGQNRPGWQNSQRSHYRVTRTQMHGNAMYLGAMSVPAEIVEGHGIPQLSNSLSGSRLNHAGRMLDRINELLDRLDDPSAPPLHPTPSELNQSTTQQQQQSQEPELEQNESNDASRDDSGARLAEAAAAAITAALSAAGARAVTLFRGSNYNGGNARSTSDTNETQSDAQPQSQSQSHPQIQTQQEQPQQQQQQPQQAQATTDTGAASSNAGQSRRAQQQDLPRPRQMAGLLQRLNNTQDRLRPYLERLYFLTLNDPPFLPGQNVESNQRIVDGVSEILHLMSHSCHALSDIIIDLSQPPPRNLRCRPIIVQHSAILQPGIPIQVEAHISLNGRSANNNNVNDESTESGSQQTQSDNAESTTSSSRVNMEEGSQERESDSAQTQGERSQQEQGQSPFDTVFNLPNNVEVLMEVSSESNIDSASGNEQSTAGNETNNNGNTRRTTNVFPFGTGPPPYFMRNFMQAVAGHMVHGGITTTTINPRNPPVTAAGAQQSVPTSIDSGNTNAGQSTQARSNTGTHPTTATQTRSTSRPHVFHHHAHPVGLGMSIGLGLDFDPYLPCNSHHVYRTSANTASSTTSGMTTSSQTTRTSSTATADAQNQTNQTATTSTTTTSVPPTNATSANAETANNNPFANLLQQLLNQSMTRQSPSTPINTNLRNAATGPLLLEHVGDFMQMLGNNIHVGFVSDSANGSALTLADLFEGGGLSMDLFTSHESGREENFLIDLFVLLAQTMTLDGLIRLRLGQWEPIARLRRPLQEFLQYTFSDAPSREALQEQTIERLLSQLRPQIRNLLASEEDASGRSGSRIDICATIESLIARHARDILRILFDNDVDDARFGQDILNILITLCNQFYTVLRYSLRGGQVGLEAIATRFVGDLMEGGNPALLEWILNGFITHLRTYFLRVPQPPDSEIIPLLVYKDSSSQQSSVSSASTRQSTQAQSEDEPMETESLEQQQPTLESSRSQVPEDREEIPETFPGHEALPSDWVPIIARDGVRQRRQLQGTTPNGGVTTFSDAYLGGLPSKRRKLIEQQKPRLLVSPTPNHHSTIAASMERLVREGVGRAGVEEVEGAAVAVAADPAVRRAFGQAIRDCLNPCRYGTPDFPDPLRFPNATKYFTEQERPPK